VENFCVTLIQSANDLVNESSESFSAASSSTSSSSSSATTSEPFYSVYDSEEDNAQWPDIDHEDYSDFNDPHPFDSVVDSTTNAPVAVCTIYE